MEIVHDNYIFLTISISMPSFDYFMEETEKYNFLKNYLHGNVLDVTNGTFFSYTSSKLLFSNNEINEIWNLDITDSEKNFSYRKNSGGKIYFEMKNSVPKKYFDFIISSNSIEFSPNLLDHVEYLSNLLNDSGVLIIRFTNKQYSSKINFRIDYDDMPIIEFSKNDIENLLQKKFSNIDFYSQRLIDDSEFQRQSVDIFSKSRIKSRSIIKNLLLKLDKKQKFYIKFIQPKKNKFPKNVLVDPTNFKPIPYENTHKPLFLIAMCSKKI